MPFGVFAVVACIAIGGGLGARLGKYLPDKIKENLPLAFSIATFTMGTVGIVKLRYLPAVILALILGTVVGTLLKLEKALRHAGERAAKLFSGNAVVDSRGRQHYLHLFSVAVILFCASPTGFYGAMHSSLTGDHSILFSKSFLDLFTAAVFAASIGGVVVALSVPVLIILGATFFLSGVIAPLVTPAMFADFSCLGGMLILATGFRMAEIKMFPVADMLPALVLVMPISWLWSLLPL